MERVAGQDHHQWSAPLTMYVRADTRSFRDLVQRLTGLSDCNQQESTDSNIVPPLDQVIEIRTGDHEGFKRRNYPKLHERRQFMRSNNLEIMKPSCTSQFNLTCSHVLLPTVSRPHPTLIRDNYYNPSGSIFEDQNNKVTRASSSGLNREEEENAIKERRFYFHPSPHSKSGYTEPELLALFPLTSPQSSTNESC
ncbi:hypothetical protein Sjap_018908 [Stephania japonica]|uniref:VQ domain-containing protein n=1 Tax=Stephania japonica TaxID=461633 RepID=A0AAP0I8X5_9MAGN